MPDIINVPSGTESDRAYLVAMDEDLWLAFPEETKEHCKAEWLKRATPIKGVQYVLLQLLPDPLFPSGDKEYPYIAWQQKIERGEQAPYGVEVTAEIFLRDIDFSPLYRAAILKDLSVKYGAKTKWRVYKDGAQIASGRL